MHDKNLSDEIALNLHQLTIELPFFPQHFQILINMLQSRFQVPKQIKEQIKCVTIVFSRAT